MLEPQPRNRKEKEIPRRRFLQLVGGAIGTVFLGAGCKGPQDKVAIPAVTPDALATATPPLPTPTAEVIPLKQTEVALSRLRNYEVLRDSGLFENYASPPDPIEESQLQEMLALLDTPNNNLPPELRGLVNATQLLLNGESNWENSQLIHPGSLPLVVCRSNDNPLGRLLLRTNKSGKQVTYVESLEKTEYLFELPTDMQIAVVLHGERKPTEADLYFDGIILLKELMTLAMILSSTQTSPTYYEEVNGRFLNDAGAEVSDRAELGLSLTFGFLAHTNYLAVLDAFPIFAMAEMFGKFGTGYPEGSAKKVTRTFDGAYQVLDNSPKLREAARKYMTAWLADFGRYPSPNRFDINQLLKDEEIVRLCMDFFSKMKLLGLQSPETGNTIAV